MRINAECNAKLTVGSYECRRLLLVNVHCIYFCVCFKSNTKSNKNNVNSKLYNYVCAGLCCKKSFAFYAFEIVSYIKIVTHKNNKLYDEI